MFDNFEITVCNIFKNAEKERSEMHHPYVGSEHLILSLLNCDEEIKLLCANYNLTYNKFKNELIKIVGIPQKNNEINLYTPLLKRIINNALEDAKENNNGLVTPKHLFLATLEEGEGVAIRIMFGMDIDVDKIYDNLKKINKENKINISCGKNLNETINMDEKVIGRDKEIEYIIEILLRKKKNNPLLIGEAGVGKTAIVEELTRQINLGDVPNELKNKTIISLEMGSLVAGTKYRGEFEEKLNNIIKEIENNKNIILFIDEIHSMVSAGGAEGAITAGDILKPYLARGTIKCIGATTIQEYNKYISIDKALSRRFEIIKINEPDENETINILNKIKSEYESHHQVKISKKEIKNIVTLANKYIPYKNNPDKAIDLLDSVCSAVKIKNKCNLKISKIENEIKSISEKKEKAFLQSNYDLALKYKDNELDLKNKLKEIKQNNYLKITLKDIYFVLDQKCHIPYLNNKEKIYLSIKKELNNNLIGQDISIEKILNILNNSIKKEKGFKILLRGSSGVGKTYTSNLIKKGIGNINYLKIDLNEYNYPSAIFKLIGSPNNENYMFQSIIYNPYTLILFDNIYNASEDIITLIKQILKENIITSYNGNVINFNNCYIILTDTINNVKSMGFDNKTFENNNEIDSLVDEVINYNDISIDIIKEYLKKNKIKEDKLINLNYKENGFKELNKVLS
jgi:ATP-dependent Clp protease ATP-binding subunit ClpC